MKPSRQWLVAVAPAVGLAVVVVPGLGAHASSSRAGTPCADDPSTTSTSRVGSEVNTRFDDRARRSEGACIEDRRVGGVRRDDHQRPGDDAVASERADEDGGGSATPVGATATSTTAVSSSGPTTSTSSPTTTSTSTSTTASTTSTSTTSTTSTPAVASSPLAVAEQFDQLANGKPMLLGLTVTNTAGTSQTFDMTVEVKGGTNLPGYLNVNNDGSQKRLSNWKCTPSDIPRPTTDNVFSCLGVIIPGSTANLVMVTTGSSFPTSGDTISITATVTTDNGSTAALPPPVTANGVVA